MGSAILGQAFREYLRTRRLWPWLALGFVCLGVGASWHYLNPSADRPQAYSTVSSMLVFHLLALASAIFTTAIVSQEVEQKTIVYLLTRPVPRWKLLLLRYAASVTVVALIAIFAALLTSLGTFHGLVSNSFLPRDVLALFIGALSYGALFLFVSLLFNRSLVICALFAFGWESVIPDMPGEMYKLSIFSYLQAIAQHPAPTDNQALSLLTGASSGSTLTPSTAYLCMGILVVGLLALSAWWFTHFEYVPREDSE